MDIVNSLWAQHQAAAPELKLIDSFMAFLMFVGVVEFAFCALVGNYPFNAFLSAFSCAVAQFVLLGALRMQLSAANASEFAKVSKRRAYADFVLGSLILHFIGYHFIN